LNSEDSEQEIEEIEIESGDTHNDNGRSEKFIKIRNEFPMNWRVVENFDSKLVREILGTHGNLAALLHIRLEMFGFKLSQETQVWLEGLKILFNALLSSEKVEDLQ